MAWTDSIADAIAYKLKTLTNLEFVLILFIIALLVIVIVQNKDFFLTLMGKNSNMSTKKSPQPTTQNVNKQVVISNTGRDITNILNEIEKLNVRIEYIEENIKSILRKINDDSNFHREKIPELLLEIVKLTSETKAITKELEHIKNKLISIDDSVKTINTKRDVSF